MVRDRKTLLVRRRYTAGTGRRYKVRTLSGRLVHSWSPIGTQSERLMPGRYVVGTQSARGWYSCTQKLVEWISLYEECIYTLELSRFRATLPRVKIHSNAEWNFHSIYRVYIHSSGSEKSLFEEWIPTLIKDWKLLSRGVNFEIKSLCIRSERKLVLGNPWIIKASWYNLSCIGHLLKNLLRSVVFVLKTKKNNINEI